MANERINLDFSSILANQELLAQLQLVNQAAAAAAAPPPLPPPPAIPQPPAMPTLNPLIFTLMHNFGTANPLMNNLLRATLTMNTLNMLSQNTAQQNSDILGSLTPENLLPTVLLNQMQQQQRAPTPAAPPRVVPTPTRIAPAPPRVVPAPAKTAPALPRVAPAPPRITPAPPRITPAQAPKRVAPPKSPPLSAHMSLKRTIEQVAARTMIPSRKRSCPATVEMDGSKIRRKLDPIEEFLDNISEEDQKKNDFFNREIMRRLDVILSEELEEDVVVLEEPEKMGETGSAFRKILSKDSDGAGSLNSTSSSSSSGQSSPSIESIEPLTAESIEMLQALGLEHRGQRDVGICVKEENFEKLYPIVWIGDLVMKAADTMIQLHYVSGDRHFLANVVGNERIEHPHHREMIRINQRLRMDQHQMPHVKRLLTGDDYVCAVAIPSGGNVGQVEVNRDKLQTSFIDYLRNKGIAGIANLDAEDILQPARVHVFPPNEFVVNYMKASVPNLYEYLFEKSKFFLLLIFSKEEVLQQKQGATSAATN